MMDVHQIRRCVAVMLVVLTSVCTGTIGAGEQPASTPPMETNSAGIQTPPVGISISLTPANPQQASGDDWVQIKGSLRKLDPPDAIYTDGFESGDVDMWDLTKPDPSVPSGAVVFMNASACPTGWSPLTLALGRSVVGAPAGGTVAGFVGSSTQNPGGIVHAHEMTGIFQTGYGGLHSHWWSVFWLAEKKWSTYTENYAVTYPIDWGDGIGNGGSGIYPLAANADTNFLTSIFTGHVHTVTLDHDTDSFAAGMPYLYLQACQKD